MTFQKALRRGLVGIPIGVFIAYAITIVLSLFWGNGWYSPVVPALTELMGSQIEAVALQFGLSCVMGFAFAFASCIWEIETWSLTRQTLCHFLAISLGSLPIAGVLHWADNVPGGLPGYFGFFAAGYAVIWLILTASTRRKVREVNQKLNEERDRPKP